MSSSWDSRVALLRYLHRWPIGLAAFLIGALIGLAITFLIPSPIIAETTLFVSYNADAIVRNPDDYKNWQMGQLNALIVAPDIVEATYNTLTEIDPYWKTVTQDDLMRSLGIHWRNTGTWRLAVTSDTPEHSSQALQIWVEYLLNAYQQAVVSAHNSETLAQSLDAINLELIKTKSRAAELEEIKAIMQETNQELMSSSQDEPLDTVTRWRLGSLAAQASGYNPAWVTILTRFPSADALPAEYAEWLAHTSESLDIELQTIYAQVANLEAEKADYEAKQGEYTASSRGLSSSVNVEKGTDSPPKVTSLRQTGVLVLIGGIIGLTTWFIFGLIKISLKRDN